jgi:hypothetical protein
MAAMRKYLRIAVTALCLTACLLLVALWVRSYWVFSQAQWVSGSRSIRFRSYQGEFGAAIHYPNAAKPVFETTYGRWWGVGTWHTFEKGWQGSTYFIWPVLLSLFCAAAPWFPWSKRFGIRTLLIAMTLAAAVLGAIAYAINSLTPVITG